MDVFNEDLELKDWGEHISYDDKDNEDKVAVSSGLPSSKGARLSTKSHPLAAPSQREFDLLAESSRDGINLLFKQTMTVISSGCSSFAPGLSGRNPKNPWVNEAGKKRAHTDFSVSASSPSGVPSAYNIVTTPALPPVVAPPTHQSGGAIVAQREIVRGKRKDESSHTLAGSSATVSSNAATSAATVPPSFSLRREGVSFASSLGSSAVPKANSTLDVVSASAASSAPPLRTQPSPPSPVFPVAAAYDDAPSAMPMAQFKKTRVGSSEMSQRGVEQQQLPPLPAEIQAAIAAAVAAACAGGEANNQSETGAGVTLDPSAALAGLAWIQGNLAASMAAGPGTLALDAQEEGEGSKPEPLTEAKIASRRKQVELGRSTPEYKNYIAAVPKHMRSHDKALHPRTPNPERECSKRKFFGAVLKWRTALHAWDNVGAIGSEEAQQQPNPNSTE